MFLAILSYGYVNDLLTEEGHRAQREQAKSLGMSLVGRLQLAKTELESVVFIAGSAKVSLERLNSHMFRRLGFTDGESVDKALPSLGKAQRGHLGSGKTLVSIVPMPDAPASVFVVRAGDSQGTPGYFFGEINPDSLWGEERDRPESFCVLDDNDSPLLCSGLPRAALQQLAGRKTSSGDFVWGNEGSGNFASFWEVFLEPQFFTWKWTVVISEPEAQVLEQMSEFRRMFVPVIVAALIIVMLLSVTQIRRSLVPLEKLIDGTRRVAANDFKTQVTVSSNDEFADLANSFNSMTARLGRQFSALAAMSEIDRHILAALDVEHVVNIVLSRTYDVTPCDFICLLRFENGVKRTGFFYLSAAHSRMTAMRYELTLPEDEAQALVKHPRAEIWKTGPTVPSYLEPLAKQGATSSLVLPILLKEGLSAVMCLGYLEDFVPGDEQIAQARDFADRIAVALSNAAWEQKLYHRAHYDALTGLPNRLLLRDRLQHALSRAGRNGSQVAIMFIDMDRFKSLNDSLGHPAGDKYLIEIARGLSAAVRAEDTVARLGGDEFVVVAADLPGKEDPVTVTTSLADKILAAVSKSLDLEGREISLSASVGISLFPRDGESVDDLLKNADSAMYHAKENGKNTYRFYSKRLTIEAMARLELENDLRRAIERREFEVYYQPRIDRLQQKIVAAEALIRWNHPRQGLLPPVKFIKVAEETGLFIPIGEWVLRTACSQLKAWQRQGLPELRMAVNISALQVRSPILVERILQTLSETGLEPGYLELELTESIMMEDVRRTTGFIGDLSDHGIKLAVDDFGTGYSSLTYLKTFLIHILKIDQSFVRNIATSKQDQAIVKAVITLARSLNIATVAEGVETREQLQALAELGCDEFQGYLYSKPVPALEFAKMMSGRIPQLAPALV